MARAFSILVVFQCVLLTVHFLLFIKTCHAKNISNIYVFGDSTVDNGVQWSDELSGMNTCYGPYGMECIWYTPCRYSNGRTVPEMIANSFEYLRMPKSFDESGLYPKFGVTYASPSAGILPETGSALGKNHCMEKQVGFFNETLEKYLRPKFQSKQNLSEYLSNAVFFINIGSRDYSHNYLQPEDYNSSRQYNGEAFADLLINKLGNNLKDLYNLGARKMVISELGPLGCFPYVINGLKPRSRSCVDDANKLASIFNDKLKVKVKELGDMLKGSTFVITRIFDLIKSMIENPIAYGLKETRWPCCATQENGLCKVDKTGLLPPKNPFCPENAPTPPEFIQPKSSSGKTTEGLCEDRTSYLFWDELHLTKAANKIIVDKCVHPASGGICSPYDINQLANI